MTYKLLFVKGNRGLIANLNGRFIFPDKKSNITKEGLYDCTITIDKDKYAFVTGTPVKTQKPDEYFFEYFAKREFFVKHQLDGTEIIHTKTIGDSFIIFTQKAETIDLSYIDMNGEHQFLLSYHMLDKCDKGVANIYAIDKFYDMKDFDKIKKKVLRNVIVELKDDMLVKVATTAMFCSIGDTPYKPVKAEIYDDRFIVITIAFHDMTKTHTYAYQKDAGIFEVKHNINDITNNHVSRKDIDINVLVNFAVTNHLTTGDIYLGNVFQKNIRFMGQSFILDVLNGCKFIDDIDEESKIRVETSFERFESFRRRVGKLLTKSSICELSKLSPKRVLGLMWE